MTTASNSSLPANKKSLQDFFVVSADSHVNEPNDLWVKRVDERFRDRMPQLKVDDQGRKWFVVEGLRPSRVREAPRDEQVPVEDFMKQNQDANERPQLDRTKGAMFQQRGGITAERYLDMDYDGIDAEIVFPNKGLVSWASPDAEHNLQMCTVYNDWAKEAFGGNTRSFPAALVPPSDVGAAVKEIHRVAAMGFHSIMLPPLLKDGLGYNLAQFEPIWAALSETGLPFVLHAGTGKDPRTASGEGGAIINYVVHAMNTVLQPVVELCASGVFERHPSLRFSTIEAGAGWVPYALWAMDQGFDKHAFWVSPKLKTKPSEYWLRHGHASFQEDPVGLEARKWMGVDTILWGNDYPHLEGTWPYSEQVTSSFPADLPVQDKAKIIGLNAARLFNIPVPARFLQAAKEPAIA